MPIVFLDSMDQGRRRREIIEKYDKQDNIVISSLIGSDTGGRFGSGYWALQDDTLPFVQSRLIKTFSAVSVVTVGVYFRPSGAGRDPVDFRRPLLGVRDSNVSCVGVMYTNSNAFVLLFSGNVVASTAITYSATEWHLIELRVVGNLSSDGSATLFISGEPILEYGGSTFAASTGSFTDAALGSTDVAQFPEMDDFYIMTDDDPGSFLGSTMAIGIYAPIADVLSQFSATPTAANFENVNELNNFDEDTTHVSSAVVGNRDAYSISYARPGGSAFSTTQAVLAAQITIAARHSGTSAGRLNLFLQFSAQEISGDSSAVFSNTVSYGHNISIFTSSPGKGNLRVSHLSSMVIGIEHVAP